MKVSVMVALVALSTARLASAQSTVPQLIDSAPAALAATPAADTALATPTAGMVPSGRVAPPLFRSMEHDLTTFFSGDTAKVIGIFGVAALAARPVDRATVEDTGERMSSGSANVGNLAGTFYLHAGAGLATYVIGRTTGHQELASIGGDLFRAQALSQLFVQGAKFAVSRERPDGNNALSFPSGHSATAFATATVLQQHLGWKAGAPAYAFAGFVAASRMASSKHYLSDVLVGAGIGIAAGRTVTLHLGKEKFAVGAAPTSGGAMVTFTRH